MEPMSYANLGHGAVAEMFDRVLEEVLANVRDLNYPYKTKRKITLEVIFSPGEDREKTHIDYFVGRKLAELKPYESTAYLGYDPKDHSKPRAYIHSHPNQLPLPFMVEDSGDENRTIPFTKPEERNVTHA